MTANKDAGVPRRKTGPSALSWAAGPRSPGSSSPDRAMAATRDWIIEAQHPEGFWHGELEGDTILESEYVLLMTYLGRLDDPACVKMGRTILEEQDPDGGWSIYPGGPPNISATVKAYFVLKLLGTPTDDPAMVRAREVILEAGGARACNSFTRFYLALLGQIPYDEVPYVPPELMLVPAQVALQPGGDVVVDPDDHRPPDDHLGLQAGPEAAARAGDRRAVPRRRRRPARGSTRRSRGRTSSSGSTRP